MVPRLTIYGRITISINSTSTSNWSISLSIPQKRSWAVNLMGKGYSRKDQAVACNAKADEREDTSDQFYDMVLSCRLQDLCDPKGRQDRPSAAESDQTAVSNQADKGTWNSGMSKKTDKDSSVSATTESDIGTSTSDISSQVNYTCHWKLHVKTGPGDGSRLNEWNGHVVGILGQFNRGKTWVMGRLSSYQFPAEGLTSRTEGMSFKWVRTVSRTAGLEVQDDLWHLVIDTAGFNVPIPLAEHNSSAIKRKQRMEEAQGKTKSSAKQQDSRRRINEFLDSVIKDSTATGEEGNESELVIEKANKRMIEEDDYEKFLASMTLSLSNYIILVVTESNLQEQRFLFDVVRKWRDCQPAKDPKCSDVFVVHNFLTTNTEIERDELFLLSTQDIYQGRTRQQGGIPVFSCHALKTRHVCLMNDNSDIGKKYNTRVFEVLKTWIHNVLAPPSSPYTPDKMAIKFANSASTLIKKQGYLDNFKEIILKDRNGEFIFVPVKISEGRPTTLVHTTDGQLHSNMEDFRPAYSIQSYKSRAKSNCKLIKIEAPGVSSLNAKPNYKATSTSPNCWVCDVSGSKQKQSSLPILCGNEKLKKMPNSDRLLPSDEAVMEGSTDHCRYGAFREQFAIEMTYKKEKVVKIGPIDGIFYLIFEEEEDCDND